MNAEQTIAFNESMPWSALQIAPYYMADLERLSVLTVVAGLRPACLLVNIERSTFAKVRDVMISAGFLTHVSKEQPPEEPDAGFSPEIIAAFEDGLRPKAIPGLWICNSPAARQRIKSGTESVGRLLEYPACCEQQERENNRIVRVAFMKAIIAAVGTHPAAIRRAVRDDLRVDLGPAAAEILKCQNVPLSMERFPFIFHVACDACLREHYSRSAELNFGYEEFARSIDAELHRRLLTFASALKMGAGA